MWNRHNFTSNHHIFVLMGRHPFGLLFLTWKSFLKQFVIPNTFIFTWDNNIFFFFGFFQLFVVNHPPCLRSPPCFDRLHFLCALTSSPYTNIFRIQVQPSPTWSSSSFFNVHSLNCSYWFCFLSPHHMLKLFNLILSNLAYYWHYTNTSSYIFIPYFIFFHFEWVYAFDSSIKSNHSHFHNNHTLLHAPLNHHSHVGLATH